jgi:hypothetical protein
VQDDVAALKEMSHVLRPGGYTLITVPAFQSLWGLQDEVALHSRRYRLGTLVERVIGAKLTVVRSYFNYLLFVPIWSARQIIRLARIRLQSENELNSPVINRILTAIFRFDIATAPILGPPFGVSTLVCDPEVARLSLAGSSESLGPRRGNLPVYRLPNQCHWTHE